MDQLDTFMQTLESKEIALLNEVLKDYQLSKRKDFNFIAKSSLSVAEYCFENWDPKPGDVFVVSYPGSGMTWTTELIRKILYADEEMAEFSRKLPLPFKYIEVQPWEKFTILDKFPMSRRIFSTHLQADLINVEKIKKAGAKIIYIFRNPKDQMLSLYKFLRSHTKLEVQSVKSMVFGGWDKYFDHVIAGELPINMKPGEWYPDHILSWYQYHNLKNLRFVSYEEMNEELSSQILLLARFLDAPMSNERAQQITQSMTIVPAKKYERRKSGNLLSLADVLPILDRLLQPNTECIGKWKHFFTVSQSEHIDDIIEEKMKNMNIKFTY